MNRRGFLSAIVGLPLAAALPRGAWATDGSAQVTYRAAEAGRLMESRDGGRTWQLNTDFGPSISIVGIAPDGPRTRLELEHRGLRFTLTSADGKYWRTD
jgi:hypothetical protein